MLQIIVGPRQQFARISDAVAAAPSGATIRVQPGRCDSSAAPAALLDIHATCSNSSSRAAACCNPTHSLSHCCRYAERLVLERPITIVGSPDDPSAVELVWETDEPYQPVIMFASDGAVVRGLQIRHRSPSIAQNYAVYFQASTPSFLDASRLIA